MKAKKTIDQDRKKAQIPKGTSAKVNNLTLLPMPTATLLTGTGGTLLPRPIGSTDTSGGPNLTDLINMSADAEAKYWANANAKYDMLMKMSKSDLDANQYFITKDNGSVFKGTMESGSAFLPLQDFQQIENERGVPGALLMHFNEPALAKDTAGYDGGGSGTFSGQPPTYEPIPEVQILPEVEKTPDGSTVDFTEPPADTTNLGGSGINAASMSATGKYWWLWYAIAAVAIILFIKFRKK